MPERKHAEEELVDWMKAHRALLEIARARSGLEAREGKALLRAQRAGVHVNLGYGSFVEYVGWLFGYSPRTTLDKLRTAEALESLLEIDLALTQGEATWSAVRELARVATAVTEREWLEAAKGRTVRDIERLVAGREPGARPTDMARPLAERHVLRFEVAAETLATFRQAMKDLRQQSGGHLEDDAALLLMARCVLDGRGAADGPPPRDAGRASYQLSLTLCERCQRGFQEGNGERLEVDATIVDMARCDAQHIGHVGGTPSLPEIEAEVQASVSAPASHVGPTIQTHVPPRPLAANPPPAIPQRATQTIPPALRRRVLCRDAGRCIVPGCRHATFVDLHHLQPLSEGGRHDAANLVVVCAAHHRAVHRGRLSITGHVPTGLRFAHADGTPYGNTPSPRNMATWQRVFGALCGLGFREREARRALDAALGPDADEALPPMPTAEELLRAALRRLAPRATRAV